MHDEIDLLKKRISELESENGFLLAKLERSELEHSGNDHMQTIHGLAAMVVQLDANGLITYINSTLSENLKIDRASVINKPLSAIDKMSLGRGYLDLIYKQALAQREAVESDHSYSDPISGQQRFVKIIATATEKNGQILIEDQSRFKQLESTFKRYVSPKVIDELIKGNYDFSRMKKYEMTVLFADLRGFTHLCTTLTPEEIKMIIDRFLGLMMRVIIDVDATVDKIVGDQVMALFGAPIAYPDHAVRAVNAALRMQDMHKKLMQEWRLAGFTEVPPLGIGINTGEMIVGNIGSEVQMDYTVLGHHVNLAARLCSAAKGGEILISPRTFEFTKKSLQSDPQAINNTVKFRSAPVLNAKGIAQPINPISVVPVTG